MKDKFSQQANIYAKFRPEYPSVLYDFILKNTENCEVVWDCATGNGQAAKVLAQYFEKVYATDISQKQIDNAAQADNIKYSISPAEKTPFEDNTFDLITVAQAAHWFDFDKFYAEVKRVAKPNATLAVWGYSMPQVQDGKINQALQDFYKNETGPYWDFERCHIDAHYSTIPFPFEEIKTPQYQIKVEWNLAMLEGYLNSWSATQNFIKMNGYNPVDGFIVKMKTLWKEKEVKTTIFPVFLKLAKILKTN